MKATRRSPRPESIFRASRAAVAAATDRHANASTAAAYLLDISLRVRSEQNENCNSACMARYRFYFFSRKNGSSDSVRLVRETATTRCFPANCPAHRARAVLYTSPHWPSPPVFSPLPFRVSPSVSSHAPHPDDTVTTTGRPRFFGSVTPHRVVPFSELVPKSANSNGDGTGLSTRPEKASAAVECRVTRENRLTRRLAESIWLDSVAEEKPNPY